MTFDQDKENKAFNDLVDSLLKLNGALLKTGTNKDEVVIVIPREDWRYMFNVLSYENTKANKFFQYDENSQNEFKLSGIVVRSFGN